MRTGPISTATASLKAAGKDCPILLIPRERETPSHGPDMTAGFMLSWEARGTAQPSPDIIPTRSPGRHYPRPGGLPMMGPLWSGQEESIYTRCGANGRRKLLTTTLQGITSAQGVGRLWLPYLRTNATPLTMEADAGSGTALLCSGLAHTLIIFLLLVEEEFWKTQATISTATP